MSKSTDGSGFTKVAMGLIPKRATKGMPLVIPPSVPPWRLVARCQDRSGVGHRLYNIVDLGPTQVDCLPAGAD